MTSQYWTIFVVFVFVFLSGQLKILCVSTCIHLLWAMLPISRAQHRRSCCTTNCSDCCDTASKSLTQRVEETWIEVPEFGQRDWILPFLLVHFRRWSPMFFFKNLKWSPTVKKVKSNRCWTSLFYRWTSLFIEVKSNGKKSEVQRVLDFTFF